MSTVSTVVERRPGAYRDSVTLMRISAALTALDGIDAATVAMGTPLNLELLVEAGFAPPDSAGPADLVVAIRATDDATLAAARQVLDEALEARPPATAAAAGSGAAPRARTVGGAARRLTAGRADRAGGAAVALVSVPGQYAFVEAMDALEAGMHPMVFSDNVPVDQEVRLKDEAARRGLLVMGPDCGTAVLGGVGLGFANATRPGPVGVVAASGTGAQQLVCLLDRAGVGVSHVLGVGGRDMSGPVGARSTLRALAALDADPGSELVVVVSKPPDPAVAGLVRAAAARCATPVFLAFLAGGDPTGDPTDDRTGDGLHGAAEDLTDVAAHTLRALGRPVPEWPSWPAPEPQERRRGALRGLFCGGTLCDEAIVIASAALGPVRSNVALDPRWALPPDLRSPGHLMIDFGDDQLTAGRPHPMIDPSPRLARLREEAHDPDVGAVLLDVVLGHGAHPDPAADLAPAIRAARAAAAADGRDLAVVVSLSGTEADPQDTDRQAGALRDAGAHVFVSNARAARHATHLVDAAERS